MAIHRRINPSFYWQNNKRTGLVGGWDLGGKTAI